MKQVLAAVALILAGTSFALADDECSKSFAVCVAPCKGPGVEACELKCQQKSNTCYDIQYGNTQAKASQPTAAFEEEPQPSLTPVEEPKKKKAKR